MEVTSEGLTDVDPCLYRQGFNVDSWLLPHSFSHDTDLLARALHTTVAASASTPPLPSCFFDSHPSTHTLSSSNVSGGSDQEIGRAKRQRNCLLADGNATKRRSRTSKKRQTTFITADPSNFRQMVQQVTGAKYNIDESFFETFARIVKPEPLRLVNKFPDRSTAVPMLDTSAFLSNHHQAVGNSSVGLPSAMDTGGSAVEFDTNSTFPTLESWKVT